MNEVKHLSKDEETEFRCLQPSEPYISANWSPDLKVGNDCLISDCLNKYSVSPDLIGERVNLRHARDIVEVLYFRSPMAMHVGQKNLWEAIIKSEYTITEHPKYLNSNIRKRFLCVS